MTCKDCIHYEVCKDTVSDENWREDTPKEIKEMFSPNGCEYFKNKADFVEIVRCKDCKWWDKKENSLQGYCYLGQGYPTGGWYCGNGTRSDKE